MAKNDKLPTYYRGVIKKIRAHEVIADFELTYNLGTAVTYLLRAGKKPGNPAIQDIKKAIDHLGFEVEKIEAIKKQKPNNNYFNETTTSTNQ